MLTRSFDVVVVGVEFGKGVGGAGCSEGSRDVVSSCSIEEDRVSELGVIVDDLWEG